MFSTAVTIQNTHTNNSSNVIEWHDCDDDDNDESYFLIFPIVVNAHVM